MCFDFLYSCCLKHFIVKRIQWILSQTHTDLYGKCPFFLSDFNTTSTCSTGFSEKFNTKFHENPSSGTRVVPCGRTDEHDEANRNAPNKPQAAANAVINGASFVAVLSTAVVTIWRRLRLVHSGRACLLLCCETTVFLRLYKPLCLHSSWVLHGAGWYLFTHVSRQPSDTSFKDQAVKVGSYLAPWKLEP
jgi:hypothetical protein